MTPADVIAAARTLLGVPWVHQGRTRAGVDCAGVLQLTAAALGLSDYDVKGYARTPTGDSLERALRAAGCVPGPMTSGAVALMRWPRAEVPQHVALVTEHPHHGLGLLHAYSAVGRVIEHGLDAKWRRRVVSAWALPGVAYA